MLNELEEFRAYTSPVEYKAISKGDTSFLGRFTFESLLNFEGMVRILTIIARGYMYKNDTPDIEFARQALCAWCSIPDNKNATPREVWQSKSDFRDLHLDVHHPHGAALLGERPLLPPQVRHRALRQLTAQ